MKHNKFIGYCTKNGTVAGEFLNIIEFYTELAVQVDA